MALVSIQGPAIVQVNRYAESNAHGPTAYGFGTAVMQEREDLTGAYYILLIVTDDMR